MEKQALKKIIALFLIFLLLTLTTTGDVLGSSFQSGERIHISNLHTIDDDLYAWGQLVVVDGVVEGDMIVGCYDFNNNGTIHGSLTAGCYELTHSGKVRGSLRSFGNTTNITGTVGRSLLAMGKVITIGRGARIENDAHLFGGRINMDGTVGGLLSCAGDRVYITGTIRGDVEIEAEKISIAPPAHIMGNLTYTCKNEASIDLKSGVIIDGEVEWKLPDQIETDDSSPFIGITLSVSRMLAAFLFGLLLIFLFRQYAGKSLEQLRSRFAVSFATGILLVAIVGLSILILTLSIGGIIGGLVLTSSGNSIMGAFLLILFMLLAPISSFVSLSGGILFYTGKIVLALMIGSWLISRSRKKSDLPGKRVLFVGLLALTILFAIPYVGTLLYLVASLAGAGAILLGIRECHRLTSNDEPDKSTEPPPPADS